MAISSKFFVRTCQQPNLENVDSIATDLDRFEYRRRDHEDKTEPYSTYKSPCHPSQFPCTPFPLPLTKNSPKSVRRNQIQIETIIEGKSEQKYEMHRVYEIYLLPWAPPTEKYFQSRKVWIWNKTNFDWREGKSEEIGVSFESLQDLLVNGRFIWNVYIHS